MRILLLIFIVSSLLACATAYQPEGLSGGFTDMKLAKDLYQVSFVGNGYTSSEQVNRFFLRRCAELTQQMGYEYFIIMNQEAHLKNQMVSSNYNGNATQNYSGGYNYNGTINTTNITKHSRSGVIKIFKEGTQPDTSYDSKEILRSYSGQ
jgi:hypothetical protein